LPKIYLLFLIILLSVFTAAAQSNLGSGTYRSPYGDLYSGSPLLDFQADVLDNNRPPNTKDTMIVDFASRQITFARIDKVTGMPLWEFHYSEMEDFLRDMENHTKQSLWDEIAREKGKSARTDNQPKRQGLTFAMPAHLPRWATRILGQEPPKLSITGTQKLTFGVTRSVTGTVQEPEKALVSPLFTPMSDFSIKGSVGRLLHLEINLRGQTGKDDFFEQAKEQLSQIKIHYRESYPGELEDDIIQEVEIGKTSFQMPGQGLAGFSTGSNENLFGIKVRSKFGPLELTTIASIENVETSRKTINRNETSTSTSSELSYLRNQFFYLDEVFKQHAEGKSVNLPKIETARIQIFKRVAGLMPGRDVRFASYQGSIQQADPFLRLTQDVDYKIDQHHPGVIQFTGERLNDGDVIGVIWTSSDGLIAKTDTIAIPKKEIPINRPGNSDTTVYAYDSLWILKKDGQTINDPTYDLMLRNVYNVGMSDAVNFELNIFRNSSNTATQEQNDVGQFFTDILGLSENRLLNKDNPQIFDLENGYMYIPPFTDATGKLNPNWVFSNPALGTTGDVPNANPIIYDDAQFSNAQQFYTIKTRSKIRSDRINLDFGVVEGSERLWTAAGDSLVRNVDYTIDYGFGTVYLLSPKALATDIIEASYQKESLFLLDKKVFIGINGKLNLEGVGRNSYLSTTVMWQLMDAKKMMPRVGTEPYNRFLFDSNLRLDFAPLWMTALINNIPLIEREQESQATFDFEVAHSSVKSSARSGGEAYIDNFSTSARTYSLGTSHTSWYKAGPDGDMLTNFKYNPPAWHHYWYQPADGDGRARRNEIYPPDLNNRNDPREVMNTMKLVVQPYPENTTLRNGIANAVTPFSPHAGISYGFNTALRDRSEDRFFEFWIRKRNSKGKLTIDFGVVGEDLSLDGGIPNGQRDVEDLYSTVSEVTDLGIDRLRDDLESWKYPQFDATGNFLGWEEMFFDDSRLGEWAKDPARDNWLLYDRNNLGNRKHANGTQGNRSVNPRPDTEDIDGDGIVTMEANANYFRYIIDLETIENSPFRDSSLNANIPDSGWIHIRIPIGLDADTLLKKFSGVFDDIGTPEWNNIRHVRMLWKGMETPLKAAGNLDSLEFEGIQFVGNQWREQAYDSITTGVVVASVLDSRTTAGYIKVPGKTLDSLGGEQATDYTLRLEFNGIPNDSTVLASRRFDNSQALNLTNYRAIKFFAMANTDNSGKGINNNDNNWLVLRFGSDSTTYYEYKTRRLIVNGDNVGWRNPGGFTINLEELTKLKLDWFDSRSERYGSIDIAWAVPVTDGYGHDSLKVYSRTRIAPTLSNITWIAFGVENNSGQTAVFDLRINGFRASGISDYSGWAVRSSMKLNWSDFIKNSADFKYTDANFRNMSDEVLKESNAQVSSGVSSEIALDKFLPDRLGVQVPLGGSMSASLSRPEMRPNSDISLRNEDGSPDRLGNMAGDFGRIITGGSESGQVTESEKYERRGRNRSAYTGYRKNKTSEKVVPRLTADRIGIDYSLNYRDSIARMGVVPKSEQGLVSREGFEVYHAETNTNQSHNAGLDYNFSPSKKVIETLSLSPFKNSKKSTLSRRIKTMSFNLLPERVVFDVAKVNYARSETFNSVQDVMDATGFYGKNTRPTEEVRISHRFNTTYKPINPFIAMNYNLGIDRNFDRYIRDWGGSGVGEFASSAVFRLDPEYKPYNVLFSERTRNQDMKIAFTPEITRWLTITSNFGGGYTQNMDFIAADTATYMRTIINSSFDINNQLNIRRLFEDISRNAKRNEGFSKGMGNVAKGMETIGFEGINFGYKATMGLGNSFMDMDYLDRGFGRANYRYLLYSFGVYNRSFLDYLTGNMNDGQAFGGVQHRNDLYAGGVQRNASDTRSTSQGITTSTSLKVPKPVEININNISLGWTRTYSITPEVDRMDTSIIFPDFRIGASSSAMEQIAVIKENFSTFRLESGYIYKLTNSRTGMPSNSFEKNISVAYGFFPLAKVTTRFKKIGLDFSYGFDLGFDTTVTYDSSYVDTLGDWEYKKLRSTQKRLRGNTWTAGYHIDGRRGRTIRLFRDQIVEINGDIDFALSMGFARTKYYFYPKSVTGEEQNYDDRKLDISPSMTYRFTKNIDAKLYYLLSRTIMGREERLSHNGTVAMEITITF